MICGKASFFEGIRQLKSIKERSDFEKSGFHGKTCFRHRKKLNFVVLREIFKVDNVICVKYDLGESGFFRKIR